MSRYDRWSDVRRIFPSGAQARGDAELIAASRTGDAGAYAELTARHADSARRLARMLVSNDKADALVAEAFAKIKVVLQRGDGPDLAFRPYLLTAVRRLHVDQGTTAPDSAAGPDDAAAARAFTSLAEPWRMVLWHTEVEGESPGQIAALLDEPTESVPPLVARAREGMRGAWLTMHEPATSKDCEWTRHNLGAYVRKVSFDRDTVRVERHLETCEGCTAISLQLAQGSSDLRAILAPLVLGSASAGYLETTKNAKAPSRRQTRKQARRPARVAPRRVAAVGGIAAFFGGIVSGPARAAASVGDRFRRMRDFAANRTAATAVAGVAAVAVIAGGTFIAVQAADGPLEASADAPRGIVDDDTTPADPQTTGDPSEPGSSDIGDAASASRSESASDDPSGSESSSASFDPSDVGSGTPSQNPTGPGRPSQPPSQNPTGPGRPSQPPSQQPTRPPTQQPTQPPSQEPTQPPTQAPTPPTDMGISASSSSLLGLLYSIEVRVTGLEQGNTATLSVQSTGGSSTGLTMDGSRCSSTSGGGATCRVNSTPATFRFNANSFFGRSNTITFTVSPDDGADANTGDNTTSVTIRP